MALQSMTGFARHTASHVDIRVTWEVKSVNGKGLDARLRLPPGFESVEPGARALFTARFKRGNLQATLTIEQDAASLRPVVNEALLSEIVAIVERLRTTYDLARPTPEGLLQLRGVLELPQGPRAPEDAGATEEAILATLDATLAALESARVAEGDALAAILSRHVDQIAALTQAARNDPARSVEAIRARLASQVALLMDAGAGLDEARLHAEAAFLAARADIQEELDRLDAHVAQARTLLRQGDAVGRRLDFLSQEFNREANTLCSKSNAASISAIGLELKAVVDQFREQVQNLE
jgi:uncharacterized protein (TIGR00255 family)